VSPMCVMRWFQYFLQWGLELCRLRGLKLIDASREMGMTMLRLMQLRLAIGLLGAGILSFTAASAWAFSQEIIGPGSGGNSAFTDPDNQLTDTNNHNSSQSAQPFSSSGPSVQFGVQQGPVTTFGRGSGYNTSTPDPYYRSLLNGN